MAADSTAVYAIKKKNPRKTSHHLFQIARVGQKKPTDSFELGRAAVS